MFSLVNNTSLDCFKGHTDEVNQIRLSPDGCLLASVSDDTTAMIWSVVKYADPAAQISWSQRTNKQFAKVLKGGHEKHVSMLQWSPAKHDGVYCHLATFVLFFLSVPSYETSH